MNKKVRELMDTKAQYLISNDNDKLQIPYAEYMKLMEKVQDAQRIKAIKAEVLAALQLNLTGSSIEEQVIAPVLPEQMENVAESIVEKTDERAVEDVAEPVAEIPVEENPKKVVLEFSADEKNQEVPVEPVAPRKEPVAGRQNAHTEIPPIKKEVAEHFNANDDSGRLFNVFKQYYTCLNETCGGTVRVTMKDGVCSLWNYDEWEEFAFVDIYENELRFAVDPRYTNDLTSLDFCEVSRLLASRRTLVSIQSGDLNKTMLGVLAKAFNEVGLAAG